MSKKHPATPKILAALQRGEKITPQTALLRYRVSRLASIIFNLRKAGYDIVTEIKEAGGSRFAEYSLAPVE